MKEEDLHDDDGRRGRLSCSFEDSFVRPFLTTEHHIYLYIRHPDDLQVDVCLTCAMLMHRKPQSFACPMA